MNVPPMGTRVTVSGPAGTTTCVVTSRGPHIAGRIIDIDKATFAKIGSTAAGVVSVRVTW